MRLLSLAATAALAALPLATLAATSVTTTRVNLRAGPATNYPVVTTLPAHAVVETHGCLRNMSWCDVSWAGQRGWVVSAYVRVVQDHRTVVVTEETAPAAGVTVVNFDHGYWERYYPARPWYAGWTVYARPVPMPIPVPPPATTVHRGATACGPHGCVHTGATYRHW